MWKVDSPKLVPYISTGTTNTSSSENSTLLTAFKTKSSKPSYTLYPGCSNLPFIDCNQVLCNKLGENGGGLYPLSGLFRLAMSPRSTSHRPKHA